MTAQLHASGPHLATRGKIRILHNTGHLLRGGIEMWLYQMIQRLDSSRFEHHVLVRFSEKEAFHDQFSELGVKIIPCLDYKNPILYGRNLWRVVRDHGPYDLLHSHGTHYDGFIVLLSSLFGFKARIAHSHTDTRPLLDANGPAYRFYAGLGHALTRKLATHGLAASHAAAESMFGRNWQSDPRWKLLYYGIDFNAFTEPAHDIRAELGIPPDRFVVGHVGRFETQKNHVFLMDIVRSAVRGNSGMHFLLIGDGSLRDGFIATVRNEGLSDRFTFVKDCTNVPQYMIGAMDCFLFPSLYEGLGLVAVEAQAAGLHCVISNKVPEEAVVDSDMVDVLPLSAPPDAWADILLNLQRKAEGRKPLNLSLFARSRFNIDQCVAALEATYERLIAGPGDQRRNEFTWRPNDGSKKSPAQEKAC